MLLASITSNPKLNKGTLKSFFATDNALAEIVARCNGITVALDELALSSSQNFNRFLYALCAGSSNLRLSGDSTLKSVRDFSSVIVTSAEFDILNDDSPDGLAARVFEVTDDLTTSADNSDVIKTTVLENYAVAGEKFLINLIDYGKDRVYKLYDNAVKKLKKTVKVKSGLRDRVIAKLAIVWVAEHLMNTWFEFGIDSREFSAYLVRLINASLVKTSPEEKLLNVIREETTANKSKIANGSSSFGGCIGRISKHRGYTDIFIAQTEFENMMKKHKILNYSKTLKLLKAKKVLIAEEDRLTMRVKLNATRVVGFCFRFDSSEESSKDKNSTFDS